VKTCTLPFEAREKARSLPSGLNDGADPSPITVKFDPSMLAIAMFQTPRILVANATREPAGSSDGSEAKGAISPFTTIETAALGLLDTLRTKLHAPAEFDE
jgi:hypothetical protein